MFNSMSERSPSDQERCEQFLDCIAVLLARRHLQKCRQPNKGKLGRRKRRRGGIEGDEPRCELPGDNAHA